MITKLSIQNFKGVADRVDIELRPITLLFGANSAGKSTLIHALNYARELLQRRNLDADQTIMGGETSPLGGFHSFVHNHDSNRTVTIGVHVKTEMLELPRFNHKRYMPFLEEYVDSNGFSDWCDLSGTISPDSVGVEFDVRWSSIEKGPRITRFETFANGEFLARIEYEPGRKSQNLVLNLQNPAFLTQSQMQHKIELTTVGQHGEISYTGVEYANMDFEVFPLIVRNMVNCRMLPGARLYADRLRTDGSISIPVKLMDDAFPDLETAFDGYELDLSLFEEQGTFSNLPNLGSLDEHNIHSEFHEWEFAFRQVVSEITCGIGQVVKKEIERAYYIGPIRKAPDRSYVPQLTESPHRWADGLAAWDFLYTSDLTPFIGEISEWLSEAHNLNTGYRIEQKRYLNLDADSAIGRKLSSGRITEIEEDDLDAADLVPRITVAITPANSDGPALLPQDVGEGITQVLPIVVACLMGHTSLLSIEQPELHVHPRLQTSLGDLFIETSGQQNNNFLIETHSEHLILRLLKRIRQTFDEDSPPPEGRQLEPDDLAIYHVLHSDGQTSIRNIEVDTNGDFIQPWPDDFFELDFKERFA